MVHRRSLPLGSPFALGLLLLGLAVAPAAAQDETETSQEEPVAKNAVYVEMRGIGLGSVNYERMLTSYLSLRVGTTGYAFPVMVNLLAGGGAHRFEAGAGAVLAFDLQSHTPVAGGLGTIGYRYQPPAGGPVFRVAMPVLVGEQGVWVGFYHIGISAGWAF